jgi:hypothetical protein
MKMRTPEQYWQTLLEKFPPNLPAATAASYHSTFFCGMSAAASMFEEIRSSSLTDAEKHATYEGFIGFVHANDGLKR